MMRLNHLAIKMLDGLIAQLERHLQSILRDFLVFAADAIAGPYCCPASPLTLSVAMLPLEC